jgi:hypothetical protein
VTGGVSAWPRCSEIADAAQDPREGSAPPAEQWLLIEHPGPWGRVPLTQSGMDQQVVGAASAWAARSNGRVLLIRRPGRWSRSMVGRRWFRVDSRPGRAAVRTGTVADERALAVAVISAGDRYDGPLHLVCTHGRHDTCCAVRGRPLVAALAAADPEATWECSHLGGCRFAATMVLLPHGFLFGGVPAPDAVALTKQYDAGLLDPRWLRGRSCHPPAVQAAQHHARAATGAFGVDALGVRSVTRTGSSGWRVLLADPDCAVELVERRVDAGRPLTCAATAPGWMRVFDLVGVESVNREG